jgi:hypothetical protein
MFGNLMFEPPVTGAAPPRGRDLPPSQRFRADEVRLLLEVIAHNLGNLLRRVALT